jgi:hypothetical protein
MRNIGRSPRWFRVGIDYVRTHDPSVGVDRPAFMFKFLSSIRPRLFERPHRSARRPPAWVLGRRFTRLPRASLC